MAVRPRPRFLIHIYGKFFAIIALVVLFDAGAFFFLVRPQPSGRLDAPRPVEREQPSADEPTPAASETADDATVERAQRRVPPA
ncbi:MAG TPA: hypothetical protein VGA56_23720 [Opitutaceae bacterium]